MSMTVYQSQYYACHLVLKRLLSLQLPKQGKESQGLSRSVDYTGMESFISLASVLFEFSSDVKISEGMDTTWITGITIVIRRSFGVNQHEFQLNLHQPPKMKSIYSHSSSTEPRSF